MEPMIHVFKKDCLLQTVLVAYSSLQGLFVVKEHPCMESIWFLNNNTSIPLHQLHAVSVYLKSILWRLFESVCLTLFRSGVSFELFKPI